MPSFTGRSMADAPVRRRRQRRPGGHRWLRRILLLTTVGLLTILVGTGTLLYTYAGELPALDHLSAQSLPQTTRIYARDGVTLLEERYQQRRTVVALNDVSWDLRHATIAIEDRDFYNHGAVNPVRLLAAGVYDILHQRAAQGGSTITQQLVKNYLLGDSASSRSLDRKARELVLAVELERQYTKDQILEMYLNTIFYGNQSFGVEAASQTYFGTSARKLDLAQASLLAGLPQRPSDLNPFLPDGFTHARGRQRDVLDAMVRDGYITAAVADKAYQEDLRPMLTAAHQAVFGHRSSFKPYTYVTALMNGWTPASPLDDSNGAHAFPGYPVHDWDNKELGTITLRQSLQQSRNISSVHLFKYVGMQKVFTTARNLGISTPLDPSLPTTLGASELRMIDHLSAYSAFANGGHRVRPLDVLEVRDAAGTVLEANAPQPDAGERVLPASATYLLTDILKGAVRPTMGIPVAAKSGTTTDFKDAWYIGYTSDLAVASWMGRTVTKPAPHNESMTGPAGGLWGEIGPASSWRQFVKAYYGSKKPADWARPTDVSKMTLCKLTGQPAPADLSPDLAITDLVVIPDPAAPLAGCGSAPGSNPSGGASGDGSGLPGLLPSLPPVPGISPPIVP